MTAPKRILKTEQPGSNIHAFIGSTKTVQRNHELYKNMMKENNRREVRTDADRRTRKRKKYLVSVFFSGKGELSELTLGLLQYNKKKLEQDRMVHEKAVI